MRSRSEPIAECALRVQGFETFSPTYLAERRWGGQKRTVLARAFPGYVFARFEARDKVAILSSAMVSSIISVGGRPAAIPDSEIDAVRRALEAGAVPLPQLTAGKRVRVVAGPLTGVEGVLAHWHGHRLVVNIPLLNRAVAVEIDPDSVTAI